LFPLLGKIPAFLGSLPLSGITFFFALSLSSFVDSLVSPSSRTVLSSVIEIKLPYLRKGPASCTSSFARIRLILLVVDLVTGSPSVCSTHEFRPSTKTRERVSAASRLYGVLPTFGALD